jgi:hypothetical protein
VLAGTQQQIQVQIQGTQIVTHSPASRLSSVLFPAPLGPMRAMRRPASAPPLMPFMSWMGPWLPLLVAAASLMLAPPAAELAEAKLLLPRSGCGCWLLPCLLLDFLQPNQDFLAWRV